MSTPPRRSRPRKPGETIDLAAQRIENEPIEPQTGDAPGRIEPDADAPDAAATDPESRLAAAASSANQPEPGEARAAEAAETGVPPVEESGIAALGEPEPGDRNAPPAADGTVRDAEPGAPTGDLAERAAAAGDPIGSDGDRASMLGATAPGDSPMSGDGPGEERRADGDAPAPGEPDAETVLAGIAAPHGGEPPAPEHDYHQTAPQPVPQGPGLGTMIGAGLLGAVLALLVGGALQYAGVLPAARAPDADQLAQQFARSGDVQQLATDLNTVRGDVGQLQSALSAGGAGNQAGPSGADFAALADKFNNLEGRLNALASGAQQGSAAPAIDPNALNGVTDAANGARDTANGARDAAAQAKQAADGAGAQAADAKRAADGAGAAAGEARQTAEAARDAAQTASQAAGAAQQGADAANRAAAAAQTAANGATEVARTNGEAIADIRNRIGAAEEASRRAAEAVSAASLKAAVDRGGPFMAELETFARAAGDGGGGPPPAVASLRDFAADGVPSLATLQNEWPDVRKGVLAALRPADPSAGVGAQILSGFNSLVAVRPSSETRPAAGGGAGSGGPDAAVVALDTKLQSGDLDGWLATWGALPDAAKSAGADFRTRVEARARAEAVIGEALNGAVGSIGGAN